MIEILDDFEGARIGSATITDGGREVHIELLKEVPVRADGIEHDYNLHFTFGIRNKADSNRTIRVRVGNGDRSRLAYDDPILYASERPDQGYGRLAVEGKTDNYNTYDFDLPVPANGVTYVANCYPRPLSVLSPLFDEIADRGGAERRVYGQSIEGRELVVYEYRKPGHHRPMVLVSSGIHPPEPDTWATESIMDHLSSDAARALREIFDFAIAPVMNPDGYARGAQAANAAGVNFYWDFRHRDKKNCPEAVAFYEYAMKIKPVLYFDFHAYTFQKFKYASPYCKPVAHYDGPEVRRLVCQIDAALRAGVSNGRSMEGFVTYAPSTLGAKLTRSLNTITYAKYHIHMRDGESRCREHAVKAILTACDVLASNGVVDSRRILRRPYGHVRSSLKTRVIRRRDVLWSRYLYPRLGAVCGAVKRALQ